MIEPMKLEDVKAVFQLHQQELKANWSLMLYKHELLDLNTRAYVYKQDDKVVGFIVAKYIGVTSDLLQIAVEISKTKDWLQVTRLCLERACT